MFFPALAVVFLALTSFSSAFDFQLSKVQQCQPVAVSFDGNDGSAKLPSWLVFIPFDGTPVNIPIPRDATVSSGLTVKDLPFDVGTTFVVTLQDEFGKIVANTTDIITVLPSPNSNANASSNCLPEATVSAPSPFVILDSLSQCKNFTIKYNTTFVSKAPAVNMFNARGPGLSLNLTGDDPATGTATYLLTFPRKRHVLFVFDGGSGRARSTALLTVGGSSGSSQSCLIKAGVITATSSDTDSQPSETAGSSVGTSPGISKSVLIAAVIAASIVTVIALCMVIFVLRHRRKQSRMDGPTFEPVLLEKPNTTYPFRGTPSPAGSIQGIKNPLYTSEKFVSPISSSYPDSATSLPCLVNTERPQGHERKISSMSKQSTASKYKTPASPTLSINSLDIETMLNQASANSRTTPSSQLSGNSSPRIELTTVPESPLDSSPELPPPRFQSLLSPTVPSPTLDPTYQATSMRQYQPFRGRFRASPDVPTGPGSILSSISTDPFMEMTPRVSFQNIRGSGSALPPARVSRRSISIDISSVSRPPPRPPRGPSVGLGSPIEPSPLSATGGKRF